MLIPVPDLRGANMAIELGSEMNDGVESVTTHMTEKARKFKPTRDLILE